MTVPDVEDGWSDLELQSEDLVGADLHKLRATSTSLLACELSGAAIVAGDLWRVVLKDCRMSGAVLEGTRLRDVRFVGCKLDTASLRGVHGERVTFEDCVLREADLSRVELTDSSFVGCALDGAIFEDARMRGCRFFGSTVERAIGVDSLRGIVIRPDQALGFGLRVLDAMGVTTEDEDEDADS